jgi:hypothetical protein
MRECPRCRMANPDTAEQCDCGYSFVLHSGGTTPLPMRARPVPAVVKIHTLLVGGLLLLNILVGSAGRAGTRAATDEIGAYVVFFVILGILFFLMLGGRAWARIVLGVLTLPAGLLILLPQAARDFTDPHYRPDAPAGGGLFGE